MARIGFRSSLLGFNKNDVNLYLLQIQQQYSNKEQELKAELEKTQNALSKLEKELSALLEKYEKSENELAYFKNKEAEIEKMSISIGTMYLVAKQNADQMITAAKECSKEINDFSRRQLDAAEKAGEQLKSIKESLTTSANKFTEEISSLSVSLEDSKQRLGAELERISTAKNDNLITVGDGSDE